MPNGTQTCLQLSESPTHLGNKAFVVTGMSLPFRTPQIPIAALFLAVRTDQRSPGCLSARVVQGSHRLIRELRPSDDECHFDIKGVSVECLAAEYVPIVHKCAVSWTV